MRAFDFGVNPFWTLRVSARDSASVLSDAVDEAVSSGRMDERAALAAQQTLMASKARLDAELAWFPGVAPLTSIAVVKALILGAAPGDKRPPLPPLARANVLAHLLSRQGTGPLSELIDIELKVDTEAVLSDINADRSVAGFPKVEATLFGQAMKTLRGAHIRAAVEAIMAAKDPPGEAAGIVRFLHLPDLRRDFAEEIIERYDSVAAPRISAVEQKIRKEVRLYGETGDAAALARARDGMTAWRAETSARRATFSAKKLDEPRSAELFNYLRDYSKELVNTRIVPERAHALFEALRVAFSDVPSVTDQIERDLKELADIVRNKVVEDAAGPLLRLVEEAKADLNKIAFSIKQDGFRAGADGIAGRLYQAFDRAATSLAGTEQASLPWFAIRHLTLEISNKAKLNDISSLITKALAEYTRCPTPPDVAAQLKEDRRALDVIDHSAQLADAMKRGDATGALLHIGTIESLSDDAEELANMRRLREQFQARKRSGSNVGFAWLPIAGLVLVFIIFIASKLGSYSTGNYPSSSPAQTIYVPPSQDQGSSPSQSNAHDPTVVSPPSTYVPPSQDQSSSPSQSNADDPTVVSPPSTASGAVLTTPELRWCSYQREVIGDVNKLFDTNATSQEMDAFQKLTSDWNDRCANKQAFDSDKAIVDTYVTSHSSTFSVQAASLLAQWHQTEPSGSAAQGEISSHLFNPSVFMDAVAIQQKLFELGYYSSGVDGKWGPASGAALERFKQDNGLAADRVFDAATQAKLFSGGLP